MVGRSGFIAPLRQAAAARHVLAAMAIVAISSVAYHNSFGGAFLLDDASSILENTSIRDLSQIAAVMSPPPDAGVGGRPIANLTFALNYSISGLNAWSYHAANFAIHLGCALALFGIVRRTLALPGLAASLRVAPTSSALVVAILWGIHPLTTSAVNYISQRTELLMALCYLLTLYGFIRGVENGSWRWTFVCIASCAIGMASKEIMVTAPVAVLLYDRTFLAGTWREALRQNRLVYACLTATWLLLAALMMSSKLGDRGVGFDLGIAWTDYALTQCVAVMYYLRLALWPRPLVFDYGWAFEFGAGAAAFAIVTCAGLVAGVLFALRRRALLGFAGAMVLLVLAPTSSVIPIIQQPIAESRMYLPLAFVVAVAVVTTIRILQRFAWLPLAFAGVALGAMTLPRNLSYRSEVGLWADTIAKRPENARAHGHLGAALLRAGRTEEAIAATRKAIALQPRYADAHNNLAIALVRARKFREGLSHFEAALRLHHHSADTHYNFADALVQVGRNFDAERHLETALALKPNYAPAHNNLSVALLKRGRVAEALEHSRAAVRVAPDFPEAYYNLGNALAQTGDTAAAIASYETALRLNPSFAKAHNNLGVLRLKAGDVATARRHFEAALRIDRTYESARKNLELVTRRQP